MKENLINLQSCPTFNMTNTLTGTYFVMNDSIECSINTNSNWLCALIQDPNTFEIFLIKQTDFKKFRA